MRKRIQKHIDKKEYVKIYLSDKKGYSLINFSGIIFNQNESFILMSDFNDFNFDGFVIIRKSDVSEIRKSENETFIDQILNKEGIKNEILNKSKSLDFLLSDFKEMFVDLEQKGKAIIIERLYEKESKFHIGPISKVEKKKVFINYFSAKGEFDLIPLVSKFKEITYFRIESPYANLYHKYSKTVD
jgi:hypothetical protein